MTKIRGASRPRIKIRPEAVRARLTAWYLNQAQAERDEELAPGRALSGPESEG